MILDYDGQGYIIPDEWADKIRKFDEIAMTLEVRNPYTHNRETCNIIRQIVKGENDGQGR